MDEIVNTPEERKPNGSILKFASLPISIYFMVLVILFLLDVLNFNLPILQTKVLAAEALRFNEIIFGGNRDSVSENRHYFFIGTILPVIIMFIGSMIDMSVVNQKKDWKQKKDGLIVGLIFYFVAIIVFAICVEKARAAVWEGNVITVRYELGGGAIILIIGLVVSVIMRIAFSSIIWHAVEQGEDPEKMVSFKVGRNANKDEKADNRSLTDKLSELEKLKSEGVITEEEFQSKKEELLKRFE